MPAIELLCLAYDRAVVKNCLWPCQGHVFRDSNHSIYYCMICTGYSRLALSFMLEPFMQVGEYIAIKYRGKPQIDMWFSWCGALALDEWKTRACEITKNKWRSICRTTRNVCIHHYHTFQSKSSNSYSSLIINLEDTDALRN